MGGFRGTQTQTVSYSHLHGKAHSETHTHLYRIHNTHTQYTERSYTELSMLGIRLGEICLPITA